MSDLENQEWPLSITEFY